MFKKIILLILVFGFSGLKAQEINTIYKLKKIIATQNGIKLDSVSINSSFFKIVDKNGIEIDTSFYKISFSDATLTFKNNFRNSDSLIVRYLKLPNFLTKEYTIYDKSRVVKNGSLKNLYQANSESVSKFTPFAGLTTSGSISRGISVGNNQNTSVNSNLDLQVSGKLSDKVSLRASIQDSNIPLQEGGYSQRLDEFDQIFIELFSEKRSVRAGDLFLENRKSRFLNFNKKVQGLSSQFSFGSPEKKTDVYASAAIVRGQYAKSNFVGREGNQGPYKLIGSNGELYILIISGSERVFVNGILQKRGENNQYTIDYNAGEIIFTSLFPITSEMRISIEYQYSDRNYTRFVTYAGANHEQKKWSLGGYIYSENDVKNQPLQQNLLPQQAQILANAGDDLNQMVSNSETLDSFAENKILYKKTTLGIIDIYEYSTNETDILYNVRFSLVGNNNGNYVIANAVSNGRVYRYIAPIAGVKQGNYDPIIRLIAPTKVQIATILGKFIPSEKTNLDFELGISNNDRNLFSNFDDSNNKGFAGKFNFKQRLLSKKWTIDAIGNFQLILKNFQTIERLFNIEFNRDWNLLNPTGNQSIVTTGLQFVLPEKASWKYQFENLNFSESFSGNRHLILGYFKYKNWFFATDGNYLNSSGNLSESSFLRNQTQTKYNFKKNWIGGSFRAENNKEFLKSNKQLSGLSQKFSEYGSFIGRGDSTKVFVELGYLNRVNDSLQAGVVKRVNASNSYYLKSKLIQSAKNDLSVFVNYRNLKFEDKNRVAEPSLNSRILYNDKFFKQIIQTTTIYENTSGSLAQQEFSYVEVDAGRGVFAWNDYNQNGIQEIQEFEIALFPDQAKFIKIFLPNQVFVKTHQNKFSQSLIISFSEWQNKVKLKNFLSHFYNQTSYLVDSKIKRENSRFNLNPFNNDNLNLLGLNTSFRNALFYNRGKQKHSTTYSYISNISKNLQATGSVDLKNISHEILYNHLYKDYWLFTFLSKNTKSVSNVENYPSRNFEIISNQIAPKVSYLFNKNASLDLFFEWQNKQNKLLGLESLYQNKAGISFNFSSEKRITLNGEFAFFNNKFSGNEFSPVAFQILEGLQAGKNSTWRLLIQKNITDYLDININYLGRKSEGLSVIHNGNIQLRAYF